MIPVGPAKTEGCARKQPAVNKTAWVSTAAVITLLTLLPILNIVQIIARSGVDNLSNDYLDYVGLVGQVLSGSYNWLNYFQDTFYRSHSVALPVLVHLINARFFNFNVYMELYLGVALAALRLVLWQSSLASSISGHLRTALWPLLSLLIFSESQISVFTYGDGAVTIQLSLFGFSLGLWAVTRRTLSLPIILAMAAGGLIASFSWGNGILTWFVLLAALLGKRCRSRLPYLVWATGLSLSLAPYFFGLILPKLLGGGAGREGTSVVSLFNWRFIVNTLGWPFANDIAWHAESLPSARAIGWTGLAGALVAGLFLLWRRKSGLPTPCLPAVLLVAHGILSIWQISVFRSLIAPWYTAVAMSFWAGLIGLSLCLLDLCRLEKNTTVLASPPTDRATRLFAAFTISFILIVYGMSNLTWEDKSDLLFSRSPASASALRNYRTAPTYGEQYLFQWGVGNPALLPILAGPLERHHLSVFALKQQWSLQGDFLLDTVSIESNRQGAGVLWTTDADSAHRLPWSHYRHLNLFEPENTAVSWRVTIPEDVRSAALRTAVRPGTSEGCGTETSTQSEAAIYLTQAGYSKQPVFGERLSTNDTAWRQVEIPLNSFKGKTVTITLSAAGGENLTGQAGSRDNTAADRKPSNAPVVFAYPVIDIVNQATDKSPSPIEIRPSNSDLSSCLPAATDSDYCFDTARDTDWIYRGVTRLPGNNASAASWILTGNAVPTLMYKKDIDLDLTQYSYFLIRLSATPDISPRAVWVHLTLLQSPKPLTFSIPLLSDGKPHSYSFALRLLELSPGNHLTGFSLNPASPSSFNGKQQIDIYDTRLIGATR